MSSGRPCLQMIEGLVSASACCVLCGCHIVRLWMGTVYFEFSVKAALWKYACDVPAVWHFLAVWHHMGHLCRLLALLSWE